MVTVRTAVEADIPVLRALAGVIWREHYPGIITPAQIDYMLERMYDAATIRREMAAGVAWELAVRDREAIGFLSYEHDAATGKVKLHKLYLLPALHGQGFGRQLLDHVKVVAVRLGAREILLQVNKQNAKAIRAYERAGFCIVEAVVNDIGGGFVMDDFVMTLGLAR